MYLGCGTPVFRAVLTKIFAYPLNYVRVTVAHGMVDTQAAQTVPRAPPLGTWTYLTLTPFGQFTVNRYEGFYQGLMPVGRSVDRMLKVWSYLLGAVTGDAPWTTETRYDRIVLLYAGRYLSAIRSLRWEDVGFENRTIRGRAEFDKKRLEGVVPMPKDRVTENAPLTCYQHADRAALLAVVEDERTVSEAAVIRSKL